MPPKKFPAVWQAPPHTIAKIEMLRAYLIAWFQILGRSRPGQELLYVDGFAGPGEYNNYATGSPVAALIAAKGALELVGTNWVAGKIHCAFIEADKERFNHLQQKIESFEKPNDIAIHLYRNAFTDGLAQLKNGVPLPFQAQHPLFVFIDPFGATGVPFSVVTELLQSRCSEVLINLDADGITRIFHAGEHAAHEQHLNSIFAGDEWKTLLDVTDTSGDLYRKVLQLYKTKLRSIPKVKYVFSFEMRTSHYSLNYYLVFASQHPLGLEKMKEAMKKIDQSGDYSFSDAGTIQNSLFRFDNPEDHSLALYNAYHGRRVGYPEMRDFALNETPFTNPKSMLKDLECERNLIEEVKSTSSRRLKGTFNEQKLTYVKFKERR
jgi:three-Cys-motif partner protein